jgi:hypothetical protein
MSGEPPKESELELTYEDYVGNGGMLDPESFRMLETFESLDTSNINPQSLKDSRDQVNSVASFVKVELTPRERDMYVLLRTLPENNAPVKSGRKPKDLYDPVLLAEIFRITDPTKRDKFVKRYPNIFPGNGK